MRHFAAILTSLLLITAPLLANENDEVQSVQTVNDQPTPTNNESNEGQLTSPTEDESAPVEKKVKKKKDKKSTKKKTKKKSPKKEKKKRDTKNDSFIDFSNLLIPITHEASIGSPYGIRDHRLHRGVDVQVQKEEPVVAAYPGIVTVSKYNTGGYGHYVLVKHKNNLETLYGHLAKRSVDVGDSVYPGDIVGLTGNTGRSSNYHLHFEIRLGELNIDPCTIINFPKWELKPGADKVSMKKLRSAHYTIQKRLKKENLYVVKEGDTVEEIAEYFGISVDALCRINNIKKNAPLQSGVHLKGCK